MERKASVDLAERMIERMRAARAERKKDADKKLAEEKRLEDAEKAKKAKKEGSNYFYMSILALIIIGVTYYFYPGKIPFSFFKFWSTDTSMIIGGLKASKYMFIWGFGITVLFTAFIDRNSLRAISANEILAGGVIKSLLAGIFEELIFRWILFFGLMILAILFNWWGVLEQVYLSIIAPICDYTTFGQINGLLYNPLGWFIGMGMILANSHFQDGHKYLGYFGYVNSWFIGLFLFYIMFQYGIIAAMLVHFIYDLIIYIVMYKAINMAKEKEV